ncbi:helicase-related protein [Candidatus Oscillochloris fontis]|uniref:helicase-related protein n=1 Tax=Candidatus Oscillochloris fontis TaxID=2496868 RepID=UPI00101D582D|nr:helicase-related protein [Candidatus Oscillochloris fontis]
MPPADQNPFESGIRDNRSRGRVGDFLRAQVQPGAHLAFVSAYFTIYAYHQLQGTLDQIEHLRFLFGEPRFIRTLDPDRSDAKAFAIQEDGLKLATLLSQHRVARECAAWIRQKVAIRSVKQAGLLHGKLYHINNGGLDEALLGSSNFTVRGLGLAPTNSNIELNLVVDSSRDRRDLKQWFDEIWENHDLVVDVRDEVLQYLAQLYVNHSPQLIYYKTLFHLFERYLDEQQRSDLLDVHTQIVDSDIWQSLYEFQRDGVKGAINKMMRHNGCIIADSVGLGKTYEALAIIKYFELRNDKVLVLCPKKLRENWTIYQAQNNSPLNPFLRDRFSYTVLSHTDLSRDGGYADGINLATLNWGNYDLVVIDESHNFRNNTRGRRDEEGNLIRKSRYERLMEDIIQQGVRTKVLLLSATPVNNDLRDLRNQIYLLTGGADSAFRESLGIESLEQTLTVAQRTFSEWARKGSERRTSVLLERLSAGFFSLLDALTIARSRKHIQRYYGATIAALGGFPERKRPLAIYPEIDLDGLFMSYDKLNDEISNYRLALFNPTRYVRPEFRARYEQASQRDQKTRYFSQGLREQSLIGMMKVNFLKRLESSVASFGITLKRTVEKIRALEDQIKQFKSVQDAEIVVEPPSLDVLDAEDEELRDILLVGQSLKFQLAHLDIDTWLHDLQNDKQQLHGLYIAARDVGPERDAKLAKLKELIRAKVSHPPLDTHGQPNRKLLVFTAFADTAAYLYTQLAPWVQQEFGIHAALVSGGAAENRTSFGRAQFNEILTNFAPRAKQRDRMPTMPQDAEIDLLIATDCISEGQNLQDCDYLVNYDIHWNPVRIIQRFGRIDRLRSSNQAVQMVNFWPTQDLNKYINLKNRVEARMALVDVTTTGDDNLLANEQLEELIADDLRYRDRQLLRLRDEVLDLEDFSESVALTEFTLDDFRADLLRFLQTNRRMLADLPLGLYAVVPADAPHEAIRPGVIFCLRQKRPTGETHIVNPLQPYYLVYVYADGTVRFGFAHPKQILEIYRLLCADRAAADAALCALFDQETHDGHDMVRYNLLLEASLRDIERRFSRRAAATLTSGRTGVLPERAQQVRSSDDVDLITWLVVQ